MTDDIETKRLEYKKLRATLPPEYRKEWQKKEQLYISDPFINITPTQWLNSLKSFIKNLNWRDAHYAWVCWRKANPSFWGENYNPFDNIEGYTQQTTIEKKTELLKKQLHFDIHLETSFNDWRSNRD